MLVVVILLIACFVLWKWHTQRLPGDPPMMPGLWPFVGHAHILYGDTLNLWNVIKYINERCMEMGNTIVCYIGPIKTYLVSDPEDVSKICNTFFEKDEFVRGCTQGLLSDGLFYNDVVTWKKHRKIINKAFQTQILDSFMDVFNSQGRKLTKNLENKIGKGDFDSRIYTRQCTMETIYVSTVGETISDNVAAKYIDTLEKYMNLSVSRFQNILLYPNFIYKYSSLKKKIDKCLAYFEGISANVIKKKGVEMKQNIQSESDKVRNSNANLLIDVMMDADNGLTNEEIKNELHTVLIAGQETTANLMEYALILIGSHPEVQERIFNEIQEVFHDGDLEKQDLSKLVYLDAVIKETMRYYVIVPMGGRYIDREIQLKNYILRPGNCLLLYYGIHRNPEWGPDVNEFRPERWLDTDLMQRNPNLFVAFGLGRRNCIGKTFAMMSAKTILSHVLRRYKIYADHRKVVLKADFALKLASGYNISIEDRLQV